MDDLERLLDEAPDLASDDLVRRAYEAGQRQPSKPGHNLADFARAVQWAQRVTDAALPLLPSRDERPAAQSWSADRQALRLVTFRVALDEVRKHGVNGSPETLKLLWDGSVPGAPEL